MNPYIEDVTRRLGVAGFLAFAPDALTPLGGYPGNDDDGRQMQRERDPREMNNLIDDPAYLEVRVKLRKELHRRLANNRGEHVIPYTEKWGPGAHSRNREGSAAARFPDSWLKLETDEGLRDFMYRDEARLRDLQKARNRD